MTMIIDGSPSVTFSDGTTQTTTALPLTGGTVTGGVNLATSSGNVGIGTSSPYGRLRVKGNATAFAGGLSVQRSDTLDTYEWTVGADNALYLGYATNASGADAAGDFAVRTVIDSSGNLLVGTTSDPDTGKSGCTANKGIFSHAGYSGAYASNVFNLQWTGSAHMWVDTTDLGTVQFSSDYRIKRNIQTQTESGLEKVLKLRPVTYQMADYGDGLFTASDDVKEGFIAHEIQEVIPSGAEGQKDEENRIQNLKLDAILAVAVKAIQELKAELDATKAEVQALKAK